MNGYVVLLGELAKSWLGLFKLLTLAVWTVGDAERQYSAACRALLVFEDDRDTVH